MSPPEASRPLRIFFFGDSICFGQGVSIHKGWVPRLAQRLSEVGRQAGRDVLVVNAAVNGNTTRLALERMPYEIQSQAPDLLLVQFGMNDCNHWETDRGVPRVSPKAFSANLEEIITRAFAFGARRVFLNTNHPTGRDSEPMPHAAMTYEAGNKRYNRLIREVAAGAPFGVRLIDIEAAFRQRARSRDEVERFVLPDLLHLSEAGHDLYLETVLPPLTEAVRELARE